MMALVLVMGASATNVSAFVGNKDKKSKKQKKEVVQLKNRIDSLSYTGGMSVTQGLMEFLVRGMKVDTAYMADVIRGFNDAVTANKDQLAKLNAYKAGAQVADMLNTRIIPGVKKDFSNTPDSLINRELLIAGFVAALTGDSSVINKNDAEKYFKAIRNKDVSAKEEKVYKQNRIDGEKFLAENAKKPGVITLEDGLQYKIITKGNGAVPTKDDKVVVKYEGRLIDGKIFDSSYKRKPQTNTFRPTDVIKGWTEVLTMMPVGSKWEVYIPQELAYGSRKAGMINPFSALIFTVELVDIEK